MIIRIAIRIEGYNLNAINDAIIDPKVATSVFAGSNEAYSDDLGHSNEGYTYQNNKESFCSPPENIQPTQPNNDFLVGLLCGFLIQNIFD